MVKDCSKNKDKGREVKEVSLKTYNDVGQSVDADDFEMTPSMVSKGKGARMVKF